MSRFPSNEISEADPTERREERRRRRAWLLDLRVWLFLGMGLAGILTVALIVTADSSYAGVDGLRAVRALVLEDPADHPEIRAIPFLGGIVSAIHDVAPVLLGPAPSAVPITTPAVPAAQRPSPATPSRAPTGAPAASPPPSNTAAPVTGPDPSPTPAPTPTVVITSDRGGTAVVNLADLLPGDSLIRSIRITNSGSLAFRYTVSAAQTASTPLWTHTAYGLQLTVTASSGGVLYAGPLSGLGYLTGPTVLAPGASELLTYTFDFPTSAPNAFQGLVQDLTLVFDAVQFP